MNGVEWLVEAFGCSELALRDVRILSDLFGTLISSLRLKPIGPPVWHQFPFPGGVTGFWLLQESHLAVHTFPEFRSLCLNVFCCSERRSLDWQTELSRLMGAVRVEVLECARMYAAPEELELSATGKPAGKSGVDEDDNT